MRYNHGAEIVLLKDTYRILREIAAFFASENVRAQRARKKLERKDLESGAFYANILVDLDTLGEILDGIPDTWSGDGREGLAAVSRLLRIIQDKFLNAEEANDDKAGPESEVSDYYVFPVSSAKGISDRTRSRLQTRLRP
jgi:hypothetical protein